MADEGRNQAELKQGQGTRSTGVCFSSDSPSKFRPPSSSLSLLFPPSTLITPFARLSAYPGDGDIPRKPNDS